MKHHYFIQDPTQSTRWNSITCFAFLWLALFSLSNSAFGQQTVVNITATGPGTYQVLPGVTRINIQVWGGGGAGGGSTSNNNRGNGGGGGGYSSMNDIAVTPNQTFTYTVGAGGTGSTGNGTNGGNSTIHTLSGGGGIGGRMNNNATLSGGGLGAGGTTNLNGDAGIRGNTNPLLGRGGNGAGPGGGNGGAGGVFDGIGLAGNIIGGGGSGGEAYTFFGTTSYRGGNGARGQITITYILPTITSFTPASQCVGSNITITGTNFTGATVLFNGTPATIVSNSGTAMLVTVPAGATDGPITVTIPGGFANSTSFTVTTPPVLPAITGPSDVCIGSTIILANTISGGSWSSLQPGIASVNASSGEVTGLVSGTVTIRYTATSGGCTSTVDHAVLVKASPVVSSPGTICSNETFQLTPMTGGTWISNNPTIATIDNSGLITAGTVGGTATFTFTDDTTGCSATTTALTVTVAPAVTTQPTPTQTICAGQNFNLSIAASGGNETYQWYRNGATIFDGGNISGATTASLTIVAATVADAASDYYCEVSNNCTATAISDFAVVVVNETPFIPAQAVTICSTLLFNLAPTNNVPSGTIVPANTTYSWGAPSITVPGSLTGGAAGTDESSVFGTLINTTNIPQTAVYTVTPVSGTSGNCVGGNFTLTVTINPAPYILNFSTQSCSDIGFNVTPPNTVDNVIPPGTVYSWSLPSLDAGLSGATTGSNQTSISQTLVNSTNTIQYATYTVTAAYGGCDESTFNLTVAVNPKPTVSANITSQSACSGLPFPSITLSNPNSISGTYSWTLQPNPNISGPAGGGGNTISGTLTNLTNIPQTATYVVYYISDESCASEPLNVTITVNPVPVPAATPLTQTICSGDNLNIAVSTSNNIVGTTYTWVRANTNVTGIPMSGVLDNVNGYNITGVVSNSSNTSQIEVFTITASFNGCSTTINNVAVTVNPQPTASITPSTQTICGSQNISTLFFSNPNNVPGTTYSWVRDKTVEVTGTIAGSGTGTFVAGTLVNTTSISQTVRFTIKAKVGLCESVEVYADVIVQPAPLMTPTPAAQTICSDATGAITFNNTNGMTGITYSWTRTNTTNITGPDSGGTNVINGLFTNTTTAAQTTTISMVATAGGCSTTTTATITIYPPLVKPVVGANQVICINQTPTPIVMTTIPTGGSSVYTYQWQSSLTGDLGSFTNIPGATGTTYQPPQTNNTTPTTHYQVVVTGCGSVTSNSVSVVVANDQNFSIDIDGGSGTFCPGQTFTPYIFSINAPWVRLYYSYTGDGNYISPAIGPQTGGYTNLFILALSYANLSMTVENNTNANVTTNVFITPHVYNYFTGQFICSLSPERVTITIRPRPKVTISNVPAAAICSGTSGGIRLTGNLSAANTTFSWVRVAPLNGVTSSQGTGTVSISGQNPYTIPDVLTNTTNAPQTVTYNVTPSSPNCTGTMVPVTFTVNPNLVPGTINTNQTICSGGDPSELTVSGTVFGGTATYQWQSSPTGAINTWTNITGATLETYDPPALTTTTYYRRIITSNVNGVFCSIANTTPVAITINNVTGGQIAGSQNICNNTLPAPFTNVILGTGTAVTYQWEYSTAGCSSGWNPIPGATGATYTVLAPLTMTTYYRRITRSTLNGRLCTVESNCIVVTINQVFGGAITSDQALCNDDPAEITELTPATALGNITYRWERTPLANCGNPNSGWVVIAGAISSTYNPPSGLLADTCYRRVTISTLGTSVCESRSNTVTVTVNPTTAGSIGPNRTVCYGGGPAIFNTGATAAGPNVQYQWEFNTNNPTTGPWTSITGATSQYYTAPGPFTVNTYFRRKATANYNAGNCPVYSNAITVFVNRVIPTVIASPASVCGNADPDAITITTPATGTSTPTFQWQYSTVSASGPWTNIPGAVTENYNPGPVAITTYYHVLVTSTLNSVSCTEASNTATVVHFGKTWNGSADNNWDNDLNWTPNGKPTAAHCVVIPNTTIKPIILGSGYIAYALNLTVLNGGRLDVNPGNTIVVTNFVNVNTGGNMYITNTASLVQQDNVPNVGIVNMNRITQPMYRFDYTYWNSPMVMGTYTLGNLSTAVQPNGTQPDKYYSWNPSISNGYGNWVQESAATIMNPTKGYIIRAPNSFDINPANTQTYTAIFTGTPNNGDMQMPIKVGTLTGTSDDKMNLIGNPYPSAISANLFLNHPDNVPLMEGIIYFWTHHAPPSAAFADPFYGDFVLNYSPDGYATYSPGMNGGTTTVPSNYNGVQPQGYIAAGQSVFVIGKANGNATMNNGMRVTGSNNIFFKAGNKYVETPEALERHRIWLNLAGTQGKFSQILAGYAEGATDGIDRNYDGEAMSSNAVAFYSVNSGKKLAIQGRSLPFDVNDQIPLGYHAATAGTLTLGIDHLDGAFESNSVYLEDKLLQVIHDLKATSYAFATAVGTFDERFVLRYTNETLGVNNPQENIGLTAFIKNSKLFVAAGDTIEKIALFDISGKHITDYWPQDSSRTFESEFVFAQGVYLAKITLANGMIVTSKLSHGN